MTARREGHLETDGSAMKANPPPARVDAGAGMRPEQADSTRLADSGDVAALLESGPSMPTAAESRHRLMVALNFAAVYTLWGSTYLAIRFGVADLPPALLAGTRFLAAGAILLGWLLWRRRAPPPRPLSRPLAATPPPPVVRGNAPLDGARLA